MTSHINTEVRERTLLISIQRPDRKNALTHAMYTDLNNTLQKAIDDPQIRAIVLTGSEGNFSAGNDMHDFLNQPPKGETTPVSQFLETIVHYPKPLLAAVEGVAVGVGTTMLLHCDLVYVAPSARLSMPFTRLGLCPEAGSSLILPAMMGHQRAAELLLLSEVIDGNRAFELGIANAVKDDCLAEALKQADKLAALPPSSVRLTKALMKQVPVTATENHMAQEGNEFRERLTSPEAREAMQAFVDKRNPDFSHFE